MSVPGPSSHTMMTSKDRKKILKNNVFSKRKTRKAAVLLLLYPKQNEMHIALIRRPIYRGVHSGQIALPGGKVEPEDVSLMDTALRETWEEVGVAKNLVKIVKTMTKVFIPPSNFWVHPFIGITKTRPNFKKQDDEVAEILEVPIASLLDDSNIEMQTISNTYVKNLKVPAFNLQGAIAWGATAMMLNEFKVLLKKVLET